MQYKTFEFDVKAVTVEGEFSGYLSVFGNRDHAGDIVMPGAFTKSLKAWAKKKAMPPVLWQHDPTKPIGVYTEMTEDDKGLFVAGRLLVDDIPKAREARALMYHKAVRGLSIGYQKVDYEYSEEQKATLLKELYLHEGSVVTFPANELATVQNVKSILSDGKLPSLKDFEGFLRDSGFSRSQATAIASKGLRILLSESGEVDSAVIEALKNFNLGSNTNDGHCPGD